MTARATWPGAATAALALAGVLIATGLARCQTWGAIKGQVVWGEPVLPEVPAVPFLLPKVVVNPRNKGVRWVLVWLGDKDKPKSAAWKAPIHPSLKTPKGAVQVDQVQRQFEPRMVGIREGQTLVFKNSSPIAYEVSIALIGEGPTVQKLVRQQEKVEVKGFKGKVIPTAFSCTINTWMRGWIGTFSHPYFAVTDADGKFEIKDASAGTHRLLVWHEQAGWVILNPKDPADRGKVIEVKANGVTDLGKIELKLPRD